MKNFAFIGAGNMAGAIIEGMCKSSLDCNIYVYDLDFEKSSRFEYSSVSPCRSFEQAVEKKMVAEQEKLQAEYENEKKIAAARADAEAKIMQAEAEAKANELLEKSLTDKILQEMYIDKWNGQLPSTMLGEGTNTLIPIG